MYYRWVSFFVFDVSKIYLLTTFVQKKPTNDRKILKLIILIEENFDGVFF